MIKDYFLESHQELAWKINFLKATKILASLENG
jgi:hypothetical protein